MNYLRTFGASLNQKMLNRLKPKNDAMSKIEIPISSTTYRLLCPVPTVLITCADRNGKTNIMTIASINNVSQKPPMFAIAVGSRRYSHRLIEKTKEFVINVPRIDLVKQVEYCGTRSGRFFDKFKETKLTPESAKHIKAFLIAECPINLECKVVDEITPGDHTIFVGEVIAVHVEEGIFDGRFLNLDKVHTIAYAFTDYRRPGEVVMKRRT